MNTKSSSFGSDPHDAYYGNVSRNAYGASNMHHPINQQQQQQQQQKEQTFLPSINNPNLLNQMSISELRGLHNQAVREAESKKMELRLVLSSRYRDLVGSSDEVLAMKDLAEDLHSTINELPELMVKMAKVSNEKLDHKKDLLDHSIQKKPHETLKKDVFAHMDAFTVETVRYYLSSLPRTLHRALEKGSPHTAAVTLVQLYRILLKFKGSSNNYALAELFVDDDGGNENNAITNKDNVDGNELMLLDMQTRMVYLHLRTIPFRIVKSAKNVLHERASSSLTSVEASRGALAALALMDVKVAKKGALADKNHRSSNSSLPIRLLDIYYDAKGKLLERLLDQLTEASLSNVEVLSPSSRSRSKISSTVSKCEQIMSSIVQIIQFDIILHSHQLFCSKFNLNQTISPSLPEFDPQAVKAKCSHFLAAHIPLIRSKIRSVLVSSVSVDASMLGEIRQSLYDITTNNKSINPQEWVAAVDFVVDVRLVNPATGGSTGHSTAVSSESAINSKDVYSVSQRSNLTESSGSQKTTTTTFTTNKFSLWSALFSTTFSSLVHELLSTSFNSVHSVTLFNLLQSLSRAPRRIRPVTSAPSTVLNIDTFLETCKNKHKNAYDLLSSSNLLLKPHEAHRNTLLIASQLDKSLQKLSEDAHHLLVHADEREESEHRLRQSLYVQTCEIMGRLLSEIRRMVVNHDANLDPDEDEDDSRNLSSVVEEDATKEMVVGRLCHLLQYRPLKSLEILLDPRNAPASSSSVSRSTLDADLERKYDHDSSIGDGLKMNISEASLGYNNDLSRGMITLGELQSAFEIADDDDNGIIDFSEAVEAMRSAFSGTPFNGAEMVRSTLMISGAGGNLAHSASSDDNNNTTTTRSVDDTRVLQNVTLFELALLSAKGIRFDVGRKASAMGLVHSCLGFIIEHCFRKWSKIVLGPSLSCAEWSLTRQQECGKNLSREEWLRLFHKHHLEKDTGNNHTILPISSHILSCLMAVSCEMNSAICPADSIPSESLGNATCFVETVRNALMVETCDRLSQLYKNVLKEIRLHERKICEPYYAQIVIDLKFLTKTLFNERDTDFYNFVDDISYLSTHLKDNSRQEYLTDEVQKWHEIDISHLFYTNLFGGRKNDTFAKHEITSSYDVSSSISTIKDNRSSLPNFQPLESTRRFTLLPIQSVKQIDYLEMRSTLERTKEENDLGVVEEKNSGVGKGFGFFSSMLKKK